MAGAGGDLERALEVRDGLVGAAGTLVHQTNAVDHASLLHGIAELLPELRGALEVRGCLVHLPQEAEAEADGVMNDRANVPASGAVSNVARQPQRFAAVAD